MTRPAMFKIWNERTPSKKTPELPTNRAIATAQERMRRNGGPVRLWNYREGKWSRLHKISDADGALATRLKANKVGQAERVRCANGAVFRVHRIEAALKRPYDWEYLTPAARQIYTICATIDPDGRYGGGYVCRRANHNPNILSTHAYGEAIDWFPSSRAKGFEIARALRAAGHTAVWWTTAHYDHVHGEERPSRVHTACRYG
jgi:hypothetical protein